VEKNLLLLIHNWSTIPSILIKTLQEFQTEDCSYKDICCKDGRDAKQLISDYIQTLNVENLQIIIICKSSIPRLIDCKIVFEYLKSYNLAHQSNPCKFLLISKFINSELIETYSNCFDSTIQVANYTIPNEFIETLKNILTFE
jgi:hypothetical protein